MNCFALRYFLSIVLLSLSGAASAVGLGELRGQPVLGEGIRLEIDLLGSDKRKLDTTCFRLVQPAGGSDLPWLKKAVLNIRHGAQPVLEITSDRPLREPIMQLAVQLGCGHEVSRSYMLLASPVNVASSPPAAPRVQDVALAPRGVSVHRSAKIRPSPPVAAAAPRPRPGRAERAPNIATTPDRLVLAEAAVGDPSLQLASGLQSDRASVREAQRDILRLEFRTLLAMQQQATSQLEVSEKLRNMESTLGELQQSAAGFASRVEKGEAAPSPVADDQKAAQTSPSAAPDFHTDRSAGKAMNRMVDSSSGFSETSLYGLLVGAALGLAAWLGWQNRRRKQSGEEEGDAAMPTVPEAADPKRIDEQAEVGGIDLPFEPARVGSPTQVDVELDHGGDATSRGSDVEEDSAVRRSDSVLSMNATVLDEYFEANPVMELADIMLSFGRVKGAAQALQEYIDNNPHEALQPWIRLMDVYRMAGMRAEFENVAHNLNRHFNVEVQSWESRGEELAEQARENPGEQPLAPRANCLEDLPRLMNAIVGFWGADDVVGYLYQLLRDNRGGQRIGFTLPVVEEILFLIELKETANRMEDAS